MRRAILIVNFGTPDAPKYGAVFRYLQQMLTDGRVLKIPAVLRWLLGGFLIPVVRSARSARAYRSIWRAEGSPLRLQTEQLALLLQQKFDQEAATTATDSAKEQRVFYAMRLGQPSIPAVLRQIQHWQPEQLTVATLYPQYASSTIGSALQQILSRIARWESIPGLQVISDYADGRELAQALIEPAMAHSQYRSDLKDADHVLFSFHGLPVSHIQSSCSAGYRQDCPCTLQAEPAQNRPLHCYRAACYTTARAMARELNLPDKSWDLSFQSRFGSGWLEPFTDQLIADLVQRGVRKLVVFCPSFMTDCLETLEEIGLSLQKSFLTLGGEQLTLIPAPGVHDRWVEYLYGLVRD
ncbi:MAG: ferrochelatase [Gammaproteobacteria bacterium]